MYRARVAGHICLDLLPELATGIPASGGLTESGPLQMRLGGCVANTGLALAALGAPVELVAAVGEDLLGDAIATLIESASTTGTTLTRTAGVSTSYSIVIEPPGEDRRFLHHVGANELFDGSAVPVAGADLLHVGYPQLLPRLVDDDGAGLIELLARAQAAGVTTSVDFATVDPQAEPRPWPQIVRRWAPLIDVLTPSIDDLAPVFPQQVTTDRPAIPGRTADVLADALIDAGVGVAMVTEGRAGMCLRTADEKRLRTGGHLLAALPPEWTNRQLWAPPSAVDQIQTTGAGDIATAG
ncbi:MAG: carbohydrate kinase family protein, partial [Acidimicrobiales bacterium]